MGGRSHLPERRSGRAVPRPQSVSQVYSITGVILQILLLREILDTPPEDEAVQRHADIVVTLCLQCGQGSMSVEWVMLALVAGASCLTTLYSLNWPVIIAGSQMFGSDRTRVLAVFEMFRFVLRNLPCIPALLTLLVRTQCAWILSHTVRP